MSSCDICDELAAIKTTLDSHGDKLSILLTGVGRLVAALPSSNYWNPADKGADITLSNSDKTAVDSTNSGQSVRSITSHSSGKKYFETTIRLSDVIIGIANSSATLSALIGTDADGAGWYNGGEVYENGSPTAYGTAMSSSSQIIGVAVDIDSSKLWIALDNTFDGDPAAGTGGYTFSATGPFFIGGTPFSSDQFITIMTASGEFTYTPPTGFSAWG